MQYITLRVQFVSQQQHGNGVVIELPSINR